MKTNLRIKKQVLTGLSLLAGLLAYSSQCWAGHDLSTNAMTSHLEGIVMDSWNAMGGLSITGEVILNAKAIVDTVIRMQSSSDFAVLPSSIKIPAGSYRKVFTVKLGKPVAKTVVTITALTMDGSASTSGDFSITPSYTVASPLLKNPNAFDGRDQSLLSQLDVCFSFSHCHNDDLHSVSMIDMTEGDYPFSVMRKFGLMAVGTFDVLPNTKADYKSGSYFVQVWGFQASLGTSWDVFFIDMKAQGDECRNNAQNNGSKSYTYQPISRSAGGQYKQFVTVSRADAFGAFSATPQIANNYGQTFRCFW